MDYEQKYNEALERAKKFEEKYGGDYAGYIFPELAESEEERIMSRIIDGFKNFSRSASKWNNIPIEEVIAHLEKQKENPKSADSIQSDCVSDAKCEDRWHKVGDSLPDSPREVLCKDAAGNYFIGRYYSDEGWEISNYDDEDKPHHLNPPVSKWIDFPSEKQEDRMKPIYDARESFESALEKAWNDYHNGYENVDKLEDDYVECAHAKGFREGYLYGLEKQKEQKPADEQFPPLEGLDAIKAKYYDDGFKNGFDEGVESVKPAEWSEEDEEKLKAICTYLRDYPRLAKLGDKLRFNEYCDFLRSLRPSWKPSEVQEEEPEYYQHFDPDC